MAFAEAAAVGWCHDWDLSGLRMAEGWDGGDRSVD